MTDRRLTDAQIAAGLRAHLPASATPGLHGRILADVQVTAQRRALPWVSWLGLDAGPAARRRMVLLAAALLVALALVGTVAVGAWRLLQTRDPVDRLSLTPPSDVQALVLSVYDRLPQLSPAMIETVDDAGRRDVIHVAETGDVRIEHYPSVVSTEPDGLELYVGADIWAIVQMNSVPAWVRTGGIADDPRIFIRTILGKPLTADRPPGCEMERMEGTTGNGTSAAGWVYVGAEEIAGRPAYHVRCDGDLWIDTETRLMLRVAVPYAGSTVVRTVEVREIDFGPQPAVLFSTDPPPGIAVGDPARYACSQDPTCFESPRPIATPTAAPDQPATPPDVGSRIAATIDAYGHLPAFEVVVDQSNTKFERGTSRVVFDGASRWRTEDDAGPADGRPPSIHLFGDGYLYLTEVGEDGSTIWIDRSFRPDAPRGYPLWAPDGCAEGWAFRGVDLVAGRTADHIACPTAESSTDFWIDRESAFVLRIQSREDPEAGADVYEVVSLRFGPSPTSEFDLPPGVNPVAPDPTPTPHAVPAPPGP